MSAQEKRFSLMDADTLRHLLRHLEGTDIDVLEIEVGETRLYVHRAPRGFHPAAAGEGTVPSAPPGMPVLAPLTGVFYLRPSPDQPAYVNPGDRIAPGQVIALIETMKLFNEVTSDIDGEILSIHARDGDLVETDQVLFYVAPRGGEPTPGDVE